MATTINGFFNISAFKNAVGASVRPNYFIAELGGYELKSFALGAYKINETFSFRCEKAEFPGKTLSTNDDVGGGGTTLKLPYDVTYGDIQLSIICSEDKCFSNHWNIRFPVDVLLCVYILGMVSSRIRKFSNVGDEPQGAHAL